MEKERGVDRAKELRHILKHKDVTNDRKRRFLECLSWLYLDPQYTESVCRANQDIILDIITRCRDFVENKSIEDEVRIYNQQLFCIALSRSFEICPDVKRFAAEYLHDKCNLLHLTERSQKTEFAVLVSRAAWILTRHLGGYVENCITLDSILNFLKNHQSNQDVIWYCTKTIAEIVNMTSLQWKTLFSSYIKDTNDVIDIHIRHEALCSQSRVRPKDDCKLPDLKRIKQSLGEEDFHKSVTMVSDIQLPKLGDAKSLRSALVPVLSMTTNLRRLALAVSAGSAVLLQGPVGSGKTSLVEHLAALTGRVTSPYIMKVQLGDQTDSKALLGTYRCTEIPGEFVWQPGVLTRAVTDGHWVLLEDIDYAPMDVVSVLLPLLERGVLSLPGHGDNIQAAPGFRMFATQRLLVGSSGWHRQQSGSAVLLEKMWTKINIEPLGREELQQVITTKHPALSTVVDRLLDIYFMVSAGKHELYHNAAQDDGKDSQGNAGKFISHDGRLISTRDLISWCCRIAVDFDVSSTGTANLALQEALDCFVACIPNAQRRIQVAEAIGAKLNITKVKAEYYCCKYKPPISVTATSLTVGRTQLQKNDSNIYVYRPVSKFSFTLQSSVLLERVATCVRNGEPVLLVGETGTGKTSTVQYLSEQLGHKLHVINMNQQSDSTDLLGGFKPMDMRHVVRPFREEFEVLFCETFSRAENIKFLGHIQECFTSKKWENLFTLIEHTISPALKRKDAGKLSEDRYSRWLKIRRKVQQLKVQIQQSQNVLTFAFIEGTLVKALRNGDWVLLDEINLAAAETLECLSGLLESHSGSVVLTERGDVDPVIRHENFRLFACMNPATDVGKKDLPIGIRNRFTELYVDELEESRDLVILVSDYLSGLSLTSVQVDGIVKFYLTAKEAANQKLMDGTGRKPHYSLRTLCRALKYAAPNPCGQTARSLYEGFCLSFLTQLDRSSHPLVEKLVCQYVVGKSNIKAMLKQPLPEPTDGKYLNIEGYWISVGTEKPIVPDNYIMTPSVRANLRDLVRVVSSGQHPVLLQGETSVGKTSLVTWLAQSTGNVCVRVNNHEHTDLQEYVGCYTADQTGKLVFREGVLVEAMRKGHWIILDELNLAPSDVLEALNRLLDDNRELFIPETQEVVRAHPKFMLFATQNPPGQYGGRKFLSRAFRNRFVELHFDEIPCGELETILHRRCDIPLSYAKRLVATMLDLQTRRRGSGVFAGKQGFITLRDLFRWADRYKCQDVARKTGYYDWDQHMADHGYMLLAGRVRKLEEALVVRDCIQKHLKRTVDPDKLFSLTPQTSGTTMRILQRVLGASPEGFQHIVWTYGMRRLAVLIGQAIQYNEPVLLVGETGCGKTTISQLYACLGNTTLHSVNCHLHTESADFLGGLRPCRSHDDQDEGEEHRLFEWVDGPLVNAMREGSMFLIDEISLADDSVLERLNSVLEPERSLLLAEKGGGGDDKVDNIRAVQGFQVFATMNPGGDFGKKELSPALRNRFTEIWCPQINDRQDYIDIIEHNLRPGIQLCNQEDGTSGIGRAIMDFIQWFTNNDVGKKCTVSVRDILSWVNFINSCSTTVGSDTVTMETDSDDLLLDSAVAFLHGACLVFLDGLGAGTTSRGRESEIEYTRNIALKYLLQIVNNMTHQSHDLKSAGLVDKYSVDIQTALRQTEDRLVIWPFSISKGPKKYSTESQYALSAPTTCVNAQRVLRALQLPRPVLLEGSPGVGKTSLVSALARASGRELVRINLSEQTDVTDLFGADLPVEGQEGGVFAWRDGPLLRALKEGHWIVLDELNLASQSVLEGLNACLDHRAEVYIPELGKTFHIQHEKTRLFACQNPLNQGGGRKGLPRSFLNRFTQVYMEQLTVNDLQYIAHSMYPEIPTHLLNNMVNFNIQIYHETMTEGLWGQKGGPWEFNLRDLFRWCDLLIQNQRRDEFDPGEYMGLLYIDRFRTVTDKEKVQSLYQRVFSTDVPPYTCSRIISVTQSHLQVGHSFLEREGQVGHQSSSGFSILHHCIGPLESVMKCVEMKWMAILIGPQSCGKTSLIHLLSQLTGNKLHVVAMNSAMDTTELLGGFEQCDLGRHLEDYQTGVTELMSRLQVLLLLRKNTDTILTIQSKYTKVTESGKIDEAMSSTEVLQRRRKHFTCLKELFLHCSTCVHNQGLTALLSLVKNVEDKGSRVKSSLARAKPGSGGGAFEWIDSLLVQALQTGDWLLIDNVNFCNASVLDRLNALLEPHGELSINERGIIDGQIPTVKPHPNFRLFLTMDPKFGEISRAMRNRGVEIYITGEDEGTPYSIHDIKVMVNNLGLNDKAASDWLVNLHGDLCHQIPRGERPGILDLLQVALVTKQETDRGMCEQDALRNAALDIYVRSIKTTSTKKIAREIWEGHCGTIPSSEHTDLTRMLVNSLNCADVCSNPGLAHIVLCGEPLRHVLQQYKDILASNSSYNAQTFSAISQSLKNAWMLVLNLSSGCDWTLCCRWIQCVLGDLIRETKQGGSKYVMNQLKEEMKCLKLIIDAVDKFGGFKELKKYLASGVSKEAQRMLEENPVDGRWNLQKLNKVLNMGSSENSVNTSQKLDQLYDRFHEVTFVACDLYSNSSLCDKIASFIKGKDARELKLPVLADLLKLFQSTDSVLEMYQGSLIDKDDQSFQVSRVSKWWKRLLQAAANCINDMEEGQDYRLCLYWEWFYHKMVTPTLYRFPPALVSLVNHIHHSLGINTQHSKTFLTFWKSNGHPYVYETKEEAEREITLLNLCQSYDMHHEVAEMLMQAKAKFWLAEGNHVTQILTKCAHMLKGKNDGVIDEFADLICTVQTVLKKYGLIQNTETRIYSQTDRQDGEPVGALTQSLWSHATSQPCQLVALWPLFEHSKLTAVQDYVSVWMGSDDRLHDGTLDSLYSYSLLFTPSQAVELTQYHKSALAKPREEKIEALQSLLNDMYAQSWQSTVGNHVNRWLSWKPDINIPEFIVNDVDLGPGFPHKATLSRLYFNYLCGHQDSQSHLYELQPLQVPLGEYKRQSQKLSYIRSHLWAHSALYGSWSANSRMKERAHLIECFVHFLVSLKPLVPSTDCDVYSEMVSLLHHHLHTNSVDKACTALGRIKEKLSHNEWTEVQTVIQQCFVTMVKVLTKCQSIRGDNNVCDEEKTEIGEGSVESRRISLTVMGEAWVCLGMAKTILLTPCVPVDPVERTAIKITHCKQELSDIDCELSVRNDYHRMMTGEDLTSMSHDLLHPHVTYLMQRKLRLHQKLADLQCQQAYRPDILQFHRLAADIRSYMTSIGSPQSVQELLCKLSKTSESGGGSNTVSQERMWQKSQAAFIRGLERNYPHYKDLTVPFCVAVQQMRRGMRLIAMVTEEKEEEQRRIALHTNHTDENLHSLILMLARFPTITMETSCSLDLVNTLTSPSIHSMLKAVCKADESDDTLDSALLARLNYSTLQQTYNSVLLRKELTPEGLSSLNKVIHQFMLAWQHQEELKQRKEAENSLYKYKTKIHGDERDYDEIEEAEFLQNFPSYQKDFQDVIVSQSLDDNTMEDSEVEDMSSLEEESSSVLNEQDITFLCHVHHTVFTQMTSADWLRQELSSKVKVNDVISPVLTNYRIAAVLFNKSMMTLSNDVDQYLCGSHLLAVNELQSGISHHKESKDNSSRIYDIYHDPNIQEVLRCPPVLERLVTRVTELQMEWPDHPVLKQIIEIVKRILSFPLTAPVIKYLTGLELLVEKAQEWESNAAKHVSLMKELGDISLVIMEWRKLELSCWSQCLDVVQRKQSQNACKWWFFLLQLIQSESTEQDDVEVMKTLKEFMEQSTLGEYEARLGMLRAFHCHMINMELDSSKEYMKKFLWNLYHFYHQFLQIVQDKIKQLRAPIEKELKGFVKIARWTDMNYWALKQSTEKTHRTLHKHIKAYKSLLLEPVKGILSEVDPGLDSGSSDTGAWKQMSSVNPTLTNTGSIQQSEDPILQALNIPLHKKLPSLIHKAIKHWTSLSTEGHVYSKLTVTLDEFTGEVIQTTVDLQSLQVTQGVEKDKQRSEAKHIGLKKRKALADLFKYLTQIGLSHRKGLILSSNQSADSSLLVQPVDLRAMCVSQGISEIWQSCHQYHYKCIARRARFNSVLQTPSKELGVGNIERCKGFIDHLNSLMLDQYSNIAKLSQNWKTFRSLLGDVETLQTSYHHPDQDKLQDWTVQVKNMLISVIEGVHQFEALLQCCPQPVNEEPHPSPYPRGSLCQMAVVRQGDGLWTSCIQLVQEISTESEKLYDEVLIVSKHSLYTWEDLSMLSEVLQKTEMFIPKLSHLESVFMTPGEPTPSSFTDTLTVLRTSILGVSERFGEWNKKCMRRRDTLDNSLTSGTCQDCSPSPVVHEFAGHVEDLIASLLLVIQSLKKSNETRREETGIENGDTHEEEDSLMDGLFVKKLDGTLQEDFENSQCTKIMSKLGDLTNRLRGMWTEDYPTPRDTDPSSRLLLHCLPLLQQYRHILEYYLLQLLASHRACSKLLSVLLGIFTELAAKGFCTPAEFEDEVSGEGATEFEDIEGGGMGEGEGAKDVSDQIENEDQLDEAQKPGEKKDEDTSNQPDIRSEDNAIEMSEDFEGKMQDLEEADLEERSDDGREEEEEIDKQMGEVDDSDADKLDEQMWGGDNEEEEQEDKPEKEEFGPGAEQEQTSELVANEDNKDQTEGKDGEKKQEQEEKEEENGRTNDKEIFDETEYDDDKVDPTSHQQPDQQTDAMELPDDLDLDEEEAEKDEEAQGQDEEAKKDEDEEGCMKEEEGIKEAEEEEVSSEEVPELQPQFIIPEIKLGKENMDEKGEENDVNGTEDNSNKDEQNNEDELSPEKEEGVNDNSKEGEEAADEAQAAQHAGKTTHDAQNVEQSDQSQDQAGEGDNDQEETEGSGVSQSEVSEGHEGQMTSKVKAGLSQQMKKPLKRKPGKSDSNRSLGDPEQKYRKLKTTEESSSDQQDKSEDVAMETDTYEHIKDPRSEHDAQTVDTATADQLADQSLPQDDTEEAEHSQDVDMEQEARETEEQIKESLPAGLRKKEPLKQGDGNHDNKDLTDDVDTDKHEVEGDVIATMSVARKPESTIHTTLENLYLDSKSEVNIEKLRAELEEQLTTFTHKDNISQEAEHSAAEAWHKYEALTSALSQELCEQLRLVLEPSQATKLRGDYRTGKRLNMRKVIPYIASQFRKDKIWLRRTKPSKRQYQVLLAIDDSSSMVDNHSKQIAYETLALLANGLALLEVGELAICSFGETVKLLHPFSEQFTSQSGTRILQHFTFEQKKTKIAQLLKQTTAMMMDARSRQHGSIGNPDTSQLLLIVSDGRGLFIEGMETVKSAVRKAREANIFLVFVIIDSPHNKDSVLDIKVPVFKSATQIPEIKSYMDHFPFPFYIILRDINNLPEVMSDALRQWFELVTAGDR